MSKSEKVIERALCGAVKAKGGMCIKLVPLHLAGLPDRLILLPGAVVKFVETKSTGDRPRKIQKYMHRKLRKLGFEVLIIDNKEQIYGLFSENSRGSD